MSCTTNCCTLLYIIDENLSCIEIDMLEEERTIVTGVYCPMKFTVKPFVYFFIPSYHYNCAICS